MNVSVITIRITDGIMMLMIVISIVSIFRSIAKDKGKKVQNRWYGLAFLFSIIYIIFIIRYGCYFSEDEVSFKIVMSVFLSIFSASVWAGMCL